MGAWKSAGQQSKWGVNDRCSGRRRFKAFLPSGGGEGTATADDEDNGCVTDDFKANASAWAVLLLVLEADGLALSAAAFRDDGGAFGSTAWS